jgi:hypothetical protein
MKAAMTMLWNAICPSMAAEALDRPDRLKARRQISIPTSATAKRVQYTALLRARTRNSRSMRGRIVTRLEGEG